MSHPWRSKGEERTIAIEYQPSESILTCLNDMRDALRMALVYAYVMAKENNNRVPSPIALRRRLREWFYPAMTVPGTTSTRCVEMRWLCSDPIKRGIRSWLYLKLRGSQ